MLELHIDPERCIQCGECSEDCPVGIISMQSGAPEIAPDREEFCIQCQHCLAICPTAALSILGKRPEDSLPLKGALPSRAQMEALIMGRRSVRRFSDEPVDKEEIDRLMQTLAYAPAGRNNRNLLLTLVDDAPTMDMYRKLTYRGLDFAAKNNQIPANRSFFAFFPEAFSKGRDMIYRGAPHMLVVSSPEAEPSAEADGFIALSYLDLLAVSAGLGTLWCGLAKWAMQIVPEMRIALGIPEDHLLCFAMLFGRPAATYPRAVQRGPANVRRLKLKG